MAAPGAAFDMPLGNLADAMATQKVDEGSYAWQHTATRGKKQLNFKERRRIFGQY
jgi:hypothetical protein